MLANLHEVTVIVALSGQFVALPGFVRSLPGSLSLVAVEMGSGTAADIVRTLRSRASSSAGTPGNTRILYHRGDLWEARQAGAAAADGKWLLFAEPGQPFAPGYFSSLAACNGYDAAYGPVRSFDSGGREQRWAGRVQRLLGALGIPCPRGCTFLVGKEAYDAAGGFAGVPGQEPVAELMERMASLGFRVGFIPGLCVHERCRSEGTRPAALEAACFLVETSRSHVKRVVARHGEQRPLNRAPLPHRRSPTARAPLADWIRSSPHATQPVLPGGEDDRMGPR